MSGDTVETADAWWDLAQKEKSPHRKSQILLHARAIYQRALPNASALVRLKIEKRLAETGDAASGGVTEGLAAWWRFDEKAGTSTGDATGKENPLLLSNGADWGEGRTGGAAVFNGKTSRATASDSTFMNVDRDPFSVACFVKLAGKAPYRIVNKYDVNLPGRGWAFDVNTGTAAGASPGALRVKIADGGAGIVDYAVDAGLTPGAWVHIAFTADIKGDGLKLYLNGVQVGKTTSLATVGGSLSTSTPLSVGWLWSNPPIINFFNGSIDELRLYRRVLSAAEIRDLATRK